jgi:hypothetical protein
VTDTEESTQPGETPEDQEEQALATTQIETEKKGPFSDQEGGVTEGATVEQGSDPQNINREEDARNRAEVEGALEAESRIRLAQKHPDEDTGQGVPLPAADPLPALTPSSPVTREELTTETQRQGKDLVDTLENGEEDETSDDEEYPSTVEPSR